MFILLETMEVAATPIKALTPLLNAAAAKFSRGGHDPELNVSHLCPSLIDMFSAIVPPSE